MTQPLLVCWGMGQDSAGMLIGMWERGIRPKLIITADVGSERPETYPKSRYACAAGSGVQSRR